MAGISFRIIYSASCRNVIFAVLDFITLANVLSHSILWNVSPRVRMSLYNPKGQLINYILCVSCRWNECGCRCETALINFHHEMTGAWSSDILYGNLCRSCHRLGTFSARWQSEMWSKFSTFQSVAKRKQLHPTCLEWLIEASMQSSWACLQ